VVEVVLDEVWESAPTQEASQQGEASNIVE